MSADHADEAQREDWEYGHLKYELLMSYTCDPLEEFRLWVFIIDITFWLLALEEDPEVEAEYEHGGKSKAEEDSSCRANF